MATASLTMTINAKKNHNIKRRGLTLVEAMMAVVVLSIAAAGVLLPFSSGAVVRADGMRRTLSAKLASDLIEKIINTPFEQIVDTYDGYSEPQGQVKDAGGAVFTDTNYVNFSRSVSCEYVYVPQESRTTSPKYILITVQVQYNGKQMASISRLISE
jgi:prepilin-type N-terminal cleavage/methylation domain-containing protein